MQENDVTRRVVEEASRLFDAVGIARADVELDEEWARYDDFVREGYQGAMRYVAENADVRKRLDTPYILEGAKSVVCVAIAYPKEDEEPAEGITRNIARYARGQDYHGFVRRRLRKLAAYMNQFPSEHGPTRSRPLLDTAPVLERAWAARAGLGFIGKNGMLIVPGIGSMVLLGEVVTTLSLTSAAQRITERCGTCSLCLTACPTQAFVKPFVLNAEACISYVTIEDDADVPSELEPKLGDKLFGCDDCQTVCPFNASKKDRRYLPQFDAHERWAATTLEQVAAGLPAESLSGTPLSRAGSAALSRHASRILRNAKRPRSSA